MVKCDDLPLNVHDGDTAKEGGPMNFNLNARGISDSWCQKWWIVTFHATGAQKRQLWLKYSGKKGQGTAPCQKWLGEILGIQRDTKDLLKGLENFTQEEENSLCLHVPQTS